MAGRKSLIPWALALLVSGSGVAMAENAPGVTATEIKIGQTMPYSGPASAYAVNGRGAAAFFKMINDQGGINGRKITLISEDDSYSPPKTVEMTRKLVEEDQVAFIFQSLGTATNMAIEPYLNQRKVPQLFVASGADKWGDYKTFPWTMGWQPSYRIEAAIYGKYILKNKPDAKIGILYQNDQFGKDFIAGLHDALGDKYAALVVKESSYETTDPGIDTQLIMLQNAGVDTLVTAATPRFAALSIRKVYSLGWKPMHFMAAVSQSVSAVVEPVGAEKAIGIMSVGYLKDPNDPAFKDDPGLAVWRGFMDKYLPDADPAEVGYLSTYSEAATLVQVLKQCGNDLSRENIMRQAANLKDLELPGLLPGIKINTGPTNYRPIQQQQMVRWDGHGWIRFGDVIGAAQS
jgi:branched-chain amino acid transport system substrate-binding protein